MLSSLFLYTTKIFKIWSGQIPEEKLFYNSMLNIEQQGLITKENMEEITRNKEDNHLFKGIIFIFTDWINEDFLNPEDLCNC